MKLKRKLIEENYNEVFVSNSDQHTKEAKQELFEKLVDYLPKRFPDKYVAQDGGIYNKMGTLFTFLRIKFTHLRLNKK